MSSERLPDRLPGRVDERMGNQLQQSRPAHITEVDSSPLMTSRLMSDRIGSRELGRLERSLSARDRQILLAVEEHRFLTARQIEHLLFTGHASQLTATRICRRVLQRLTEARVLVRLERRVGGARAGSASYVYAVGPAGDRILQRRKPTPLGSGTDPSLPRPHPRRRGRTHRPHRSAPRRNDQARRRRGRARLLAPVHRARGQPGNHQARPVRRHGGRRVRAPLVPRDRPRHREPRLRSRGSAAPGAPTTAAGANRQRSGGFPLSGLGRAERASGSRHRTRDRGHGSPREDVVPGHDERAAGRADRRSDVMIGARPDPGRRRGQRAAAGSRTASSTAS